MIRTQPRRSAARQAVAAIAIAVLIALAAAAAVALPAGAAPRPFPVCIKLGGQAGPDLAGAMAVWTDNRNGNLDVYAKNLSTGREYAVVTNREQQDNPAVTRYVEGGRVHYVVVWVDKRNHATGEASDIYGRDLTTRRSFKVAGGATFKWYPDIVDHWVVWVEADDAAGPYRIKVRDLAAGKTYPAIAESEVLSPPSIDRRTVGTRKVYTAVYTSGKGNISGRNLPGGAQFVVSARRLFEWLPDISGNRVVWWESGGRIMMRNLRTGKRSFVHRGSRPRIDGRRVTWDGGGSGGSFVISYRPNARIYVRDVTRRGVTTIGQTDLTCLFPVVSGRRVVWESGPAERVFSHIHIYGARLR